MADSDRSRSPMPGRNRTEPRGQGQVPRPDLPFFHDGVGPCNQHCCTLRTCRALSSDLSGQRTRLDLI